MTAFWLRSNAVRFVRVFIFGMVLIVSHSSIRMHTLKCCGSKTQNIFIDNSGVHKLGDFGISRELKQDAMAQTACGTPYFMPPEVCLGKPYDSKADVWAIGVIIYELIMLKKPFRGEEILNVLQSITKSSYDPLYDDSDPDLKQLVVSLLQKDFNNP